MGIAFDSNAGHSVSKSANAITIVTSNITLVQNNIIVVGVAILNNTTSVSSVTDSLGNTYSLTKVAFVTSQIRVELWTTKHTTATGTATVTVTIGVAEKTDIGVVQYSGVATISSNTGSNTGVGTATSVSLTTQSPTSWEVGVVGLDNAHTFAAGSGTNQRLTLGANGTAIGMADSGEIIVQGTTQTLNETAGSSANWAFASVELQSINFNQVSVSETNTVSDSTQKKKSVVVTELGAVSETIFRSAQPTPLVESTSVSDTTKKFLLFSLSSSSAITETLIKTGLLSRSEAVILADSLVLSKAGKNMFEAVFLSDSTTLKRFMSASETISVSETLNIMNILFLTEDDIDIEEFLDRRAAFNRELGDIAAILESLYNSKIPFSKLYRSDLLYDVIAGTATLNFYIGDDTAPRVVLTFDAKNTSGFPFSRSTSQDNVVPIETYRVAIGDEETWIGEIQRRFTSNFIVSPAAQIGKTNSLGIEVLKEPTEPRIQLILRTDGTILRVAASWNQTTKAVTISATPGGPFGLADFIRFLRNSEEFYLMIVDMIQRGG